MTYLTPQKSKTSKNPPCFDTNKINKKRKQLNEIKLQIKKFKYIVLISD